LTGSLCPISIQGSPVTLLKFQKAPRLILFMSSYINTNEMQLFSFYLVFITLHVSDATTVCNTPDDGRKTASETCRVIKTK